MKFNSIFLVLLAAPVADAASAAQTEDLQPVGATCKTKYMSVNNGLDKYTKSTGTDALNCAAGLVCMPLPEDEATKAKGDLLTGTCNTTMCAGNSDPDDLSEGDLDASNEATIRVTICHRTCSQTNPWVRITIDDDAWNGTHASGCGHQQHDVRDECAKYGPINNWAAWGANRKDYLLKWHGTRDFVRQTNGWAAPIQGPGNSGVSYSTAEKTYWSYWERACPYVRGTGCCDWEKGSCCGDNPNLKPAIDLQKTAGPPGTCGVDMSKQVEVHVGTAGANFEYCYAIKNTGNVCLDDLTMADTAVSPAVAIATPLTAFGYDAAFKLCPGEVTYVKNPRPIPQGPEGPFVAVVHGRQVGVTAGVAATVQDSDTAAVVPAGINVEKTAGPPGTCGVEPMTGQVELYGAAVGAAFEWCYKVTNLGGSCLKDVTMTDSSAGFADLALAMTGSPPSGITLLSDPTFAESFCPGEVFYVKVDSTIPAGGKDGPVTVSGTPPCPNSPKVTDTDPAAVVPAAIELQKTAGPTGTCGIDMSQQTESYEAAVGAPFVYCYAISVPAGGICVNSILMSDSDIANKFDDVPITPSTTGVTVVGNYVDALCSGTTIYYSVPSSVPGPDGESKTADVSGVGVVPSGVGPTVTDDDPAGVAPPDAPPAILLAKTAGPVGTCGNAALMGQQVELYEADQGEAFEYCYKITNPGFVCLNQLLMADPSIASHFTGESVSSASTGGNPSFAGGVAGFIDTLCAGESVYFKMESTVPSSQEGPFPATATGSPVGGGAAIESSDPAAVKPIPLVPVINLEKTAGPPGSCGGSMAGQIELYTDTLESAFEYCYKISVPPGAICVNNLMMKDVAASIAFEDDPITSSNPGVVSSSSADFVDELCAGDFVYVKKPSTIPGPNGEGPDDATVDATGPNGEPATATDPAGVQASVLITLDKKAGPRGTCGVDMSQQLELYEDALGAEFEYCYVITNPGGVCLKDITMSDPSIAVPFTDQSITGTLPSGFTLALDGLNFVDVLCAEETVYFSYDSTIPGLETFDAVVNAKANTPAETPVSAQDHAGVDIPEDEIVTPAPQVDPTPAPQVDSTPAPQVDSTPAPQVDSTPAPQVDSTPAPVTPSCDNEMPGKGSDYCGGYPGVDVINVIGPAPSAADADILWSITAAADGKSVSFKVTSPFEGLTDIYTQYHKPTGTGGGWFEACDGDMDVAECGPGASTIVADCIEAEGDPFSVIQVYFVSGAAGFLGGATVDECCHEGQSPPVGAVAQYTFLVSCSCPMESRMLRGN